MHVKTVHSHKLFEDKYPMMRNHLILPPCKDVFIYNIINIRHYNNILILSMYIFDKTLAMRVKAHLIRPVPFSGFSSDVSINMDGQAMKVFVFNYKI